MKKLILIILCVSGIFIARAQQVTSFPVDDQEKFIKALDQFMSASKSELNMNTSDEFKKMVKDGKVSAAWMPDIMSTANVMAGRLMAPAPHFYNYLNAVINAAKGGKTDIQFAEWTKLLNAVSQDQKKGDNGNFLKMVEFSNVFFSQGALSSSPSKTWKVESNDYKFTYLDGKPRVTFPLTTVLGCSHDDTIYIRQTLGDYLPLENKWVGKSGKVDWSRVGLDPNKVYCTFKNYSINLINYNYIVDTVTFYHSEYFKTPILGKLSDKIIAGGDSSGLRYPRFESYEGGMTIKDIAPNVAFTGSFGLYGSKVIGNSVNDVKAQLTFYARDGKTKVLSAKSNSISIKKGEELGADRAEVAIYFGTDSIYHPQLNVVYKIPKREVRLLRGETGLGKSKFFDSYHNHEFQTDAIFWNLDSTILNLKILSGVGKKPGIFESANYFNKEVIRKQQGLASYEPLSVLKKLYEKTGSKDVSATEVARALDPHLTEGECKSLFYELVENGFIAYNEEFGVVTIKDKAINYVLANARKIDYDIIRIKSAPQTGNDYIDLKNNNIDLKGVQEVPISDTAYVYFQPKNNSISLQKDRNMEFDGLIYAGRMDLYGQKYKFKYTPFTVELTQVDTLIINVQDSGKVNMYGEPILKPLRSRVENLKGLLEIDAPINKSGRTRLPQFPRLYSREKSYIYYDDTTVAKGAYNRKNFYFELEPFRLDSLNNFSGDIINWQGRLVSGGIFPDIKDSVKIQADGSLGFKSETPPGGYDIYGGKGKYYGKFQLSYTGMAGDARITHSTADFTTHDVRLYPDSLLGTTDSFTIAKTFEGVKTPSVTGHDDRIFWRPKADSMLISMQKPENPFFMYDSGFTTFKGDLMLTNKGLHGNGTLDWNEATLSSKDFALRTMDLSSDTAALNIKTTGDRVTFKTPNVSAKVDFKTRIGDFKSNQKNIPTEFSYNQYTTNINEFKWFMDEKILDFKAPPQGPGEYFTSTRPEQKGLKFLGKRAIYYLVTSLLRIEQVPEIKVADASVVPDSGLVIIEGEAKMQQLKNAVIYADTTTKIHKIENATVDIYSKNELKGVGTYNYVTKDVKEVIDFTDIGTKKVGVTKRKQVESWLLYAKAPIRQDKNFVLYPEVKFEGDITLTSVNPLLNFKGYAKLDLKNPLANSHDFFINQDVDPKVLGLRYDTAKSSYGHKLVAGINLHQSDDSAIMYTTLLAPKRDAKDNAMFKSVGIVAQDKAGNFQFGSEKKIRDNVSRGNVMKFDDKKGIVNAEGKFSLGANFGIIRTIAAGSAEVKLDSLLYKFNLTMGIDMRMEDKMAERFEFYMMGDNADQPDISYEGDKQKKAILELTTERDDKKLAEEFERSGIFNKRPKALDHYMVFNDVNFVFDTADYLLRSVGKIGVALIGKKVVNKKLEGHIEIQYKGGYDVISIYLQTGTKDWFYFEYHPGTLGLLSSYDTYNNLINGVSPDKRRVKGPGGSFYHYDLGSSVNKAEFLSYMKDKAEGIYHPRMEPVITESLPAGDSSLLFQNILMDSTSYEQQIQQEEQPKITPEELERMEQQKEINQMEEMKMNNQNILSGPPPDRVPKKEEPVKEEPKAEPVKEEPKAEPVKEEPKMAEPVKEEPKAEPVKEEPKVEPVKEEPKVEPVKDEPKAEPVIEQPKENAPAPEAPKEEKPKKKKKDKQEEPKTEEPKAEPNTEGTTPPEPPKTEEPKAEPTPTGTPPTGTEPPKEEPKPQETPPVQEEPK